MRIKYYILTIFSLLSLAGYMQTVQINDFSQLMESLNSGEQVRIIIHYSKCEWQSKEMQVPIPEAISGLDIDVYEYFAAGAINNPMAFVVFSTSKLIQNPHGKGFVYNYGKFRINADNTVIITAMYIQPKSYKVLMQDNYSGKINDGNNEYGVYLFKQI